MFTCLLCLSFIRYVRLLGAMYMRLTGTSTDCYKYLEPLYNDYRKIKSQNRNGGEFTSGITPANIVHVKTVQNATDLLLL